jgi:hypothetical protein
MGVLRVLSGAAMAVALAVAAPAAARPAAGAAQPADLTPQQAADLGTEAFVYGFPLMEFLRVRRASTSVRCPDHRGHAPVNAFSAFTRLATPRERDVVAPNVDTLYLVASLDLGRGPVVLRHPAMGRRYFVLQLLDPYTNTLGYIGSRTTGSRAGRFAIAWRGHGGRRPRGTRLVRSPSRRVWVIGRVLVRGATDQRRARRLMRRFTLTQPGGRRPFAPGCEPGTPGRPAAPRGLGWLRALNRGLAANPPPARDASELERLAAIGVGAGRDPARAGLDRAALRALAATIDATADAFVGIATRAQVDGAAAGGGWSVPADDIGDYGTDYAYRAGVAALGLGANTREEAIYPTAFLDAAGAPLDGAHAYRVVFAPGQAPPQRGFWSLTAYDAAGFLVANPARRHAIGPTHGGLVRRADGAIEVAVQHDRPSDPAVNWLPVPAGPFRLTLRVYVPEPPALDGTWAPPPVQRVDGA